MDKKRTRNPNFSSAEKNTLLQCVYNEKNVVENKKTDGATWKEKEEAWSRITSNFNSQSGGTCSRNTEALKKCYINYKKDVRKEAAAEKCSSLQTGSGKPYKVRDPNFELAVSIMNSKTVHGLINVFDSDAIETNQDNDIANNTADEPTVDWGSYKPAQLKMPVHSKLKTKLVNDSLPKPCSPDKKTTDDTSTIMSKGFRKQYEDTDLNSPRASNSNTMKWSGRRRTVASTLNSSKITEQYSELSKIKIELAKLQYEAIKEEGITKKYTDSVEHDLRKKSLELDIEIKAEILKKIKTNSLNMGETSCFLKKHRKFA